MTFKHNADDLALLDESQHLFDIVLASKILTHTDTHPIVVKSALKRLEATMPENLNPQRRLSVSLQCIRNCVFGRLLNSSIELISDNDICFRGVVKEAYGDPNINTDLKKNENHYVDPSFLLSDKLLSIPHHALSTAFAAITPIEQQIVARGLKELCNRNEAFAFTGNPVTLMFVKDLLREFDDDCSHADVMPVLSSKGRFSQCYINTLKNGLSDINFVAKIIAIDIEDPDANALLYEISQGYCNLIGAIRLKHIATDKILEEGIVICEKINKLNNDIINLAGARKTDEEYQYLIGCVLNLLGIYTNRVTSDVIIAAAPTKE